MAKKTLSSTQRSLNLWAIIVIVWSIYRAKFQTLLPLWFDELVMKPLVFIVPIAYYIIVTEKKSFLQGIWFNQKTWKSDVLWGTLFGLLLVAVGLASRGIRTGSFTFSPTEPLLLLIIITFATAVSEEIISRGFVLKRLYEDSKNMVTSSFFASVLYFFLKVPILFTNSRISGAVLLQVMFIDIVFSLAISLLFLMRRSILIAIIIHAFYNFTLMAMM